MAFISKNGVRVSYDASALIAELKTDIEEFGDFPVWVITQEREGVTIYKDYEDASGPFDMPAKDDEKIVKLPAKKLLELYIKENSVI